MLGPEPDVFIEVKHLDLAPRDPGLLRQGVEKLELRFTCRDQNPGRPPSGDRRANQPRRLLRRRATQRDLVRKDLDFHRDPAITTQDKFRRKPPAPIWSAATRRRFRRRTRWNHRQDAA